MHVSNWGAPIAIHAVPIQYQFNTYSELMIYVPLIVEKSNELLLQNHDMRPRVSNSARSTC